MKKIYKIIFIILAIILLGASAFSFAKYIGNAMWDYYLESQGFYFSSSHLNGEINLNNNWNGSSVAFELSNYDKNGEVSSFEIQYDLTCSIIGDVTGNLTCELNGTSSSEYSGTLQRIEVCRNDSTDGVDTSTLDEETCNNRGYTWVNGNSSIYQFFEIKSTDPNQDIDNVTVKIEAKSTAPYSKTLEGEFRLKKGESTADDIIIEHESFDDYEKVIISNYSHLTKDFFLRWNSSKLRISKGDYISEVFSPEGYITEVDFSIAKDRTITYTFYKTDSNDVITVDDFSLIEKPMIESIRVRTIELTEFSSGVTEISSPTFTDNSTQIHVNLPSSTSTFTYTVTIENTTSNHYYLKDITEVVNSENLTLVPIGLSKYHEFAPGTIATFYLIYTGDGTLNSNEVLFDFQYLYEEGEVYKDETLNGATPEIIDGLIPIIYNESLGKWVKADVLNEEWYDYSVLRWANATSVISSQREYYTEAEPGVVVEMNHMISMMVWIPRYAYTIKQDYGVLGYNGSPLSIETPGAIDIKFQGVNEQSVGSGSYTGDIPSNYYTPSSFCWGNTCDDPDTRNDEGNEEIKGFWIAKFEASKVGNLLYSKPNVKPMVNFSTSSTFYYVQDLMNDEAGYTNYGYVGFVDAHLIKNTEWGAIAYLSQSKFGKYGNTAYTGVNKEIYLNNCSTYITGIGGASAADGRTTLTCNDDNHRYNSYNGMGASTTGNIYGVYDMIGGTFDRVMGVVLGPNGEFIPDSSGFTSLPEGRYINVYPYGTYTQGDISPIKGDALTETLYYYSDRYLSDPRFSSTNYNLYHWFYRGGSLFFPNTEANGIFSYTLFNGIADGHHSSRFTITMYGSLVENF